MSESEILTEEEVYSVKNVLSNALTLIKTIEGMRKSKLLVFYCHQSISHSTAYRINKILRKMEPIENLDVLLESGGGDLNASYKILKMFRLYAKRTRVIVPFFAKSAASLIAVGADELSMLKGGELGPIDPQVREPFSGRFIPANSIKEAINFIEETKDPLVKLSLADKISPLLMGAFRQTALSSKQYLDEILAKLGDKKAEAINTFAERFLSHGYPMDREFLGKIGINVVDLDAKTEHVLCDLHEMYTDLCNELYARHQDQPGILIIQSNNGQSVIFGNQDITNGLDALVHKEMQVSVREAAGHTDIKA